MDYTWSNTYKYLGVLLNLRGSIVLHFKIMKEIANEIVGE